MGKPRSDAKLLNLPAEQQDKIADWLLDGVETEDGLTTSYKAVAAQVYLDLGVKTSVGALYEFYRQVCAPRRLRRASVAAEQFAGVVNEGADFAAPTIALLRQKAFEILAADKTDPKELLAFFGSVLDQQKLELKTRELDLRSQDTQIKLRRLELIERQAVAAKEKLTAIVAKGGITPETLKIIEEAAGLL